MNKRVVFFVKQSGGGRGGEGDGKKNARAH